MTRKISLLLALLFIPLSLTACVKTKTLHCDYCGTEITVAESNKMEEDWIIYCEKCNEELFGDDPVLGNGNNK